jgi:cytochrome oxidase assembly protein ShyY1
MFSKNLLVKHSREFVIFVFIFLILISLGSWQLLRLESKNNYVSEVLKSVSNKPHRVESLSDLKEYRNIIIDGKIDSSKLLWLYRRHPMAKYKDGAYLVANIMGNNDVKITAVLGWFESKSFKKIENEISEKNKIELKGLLIPSESESFLIPKNDFEKKLIFTMSLGTISKYFNAVENKFFVAATELSSKFDTEFLPITPKMMIKIRNDHTEYAVTWFSLAVFWGLIFYLYIRKKLK